MESMMTGMLQTQQMQITQQTQVRLMKTSLNTQKEVGEAIISLIDATVSGFGTGSDARREKSLIGGKNLDTSG